MKFLVMNHSHPLTTSNPCSFASWENLLQFPPQNAAPAMALAAPNPMHNCDGTSRRAAPEEWLNIKLWSMIDDWPASVITCYNYEWW